MRATGKKENREREREKKAVFLETNKQTFGFKSEMVRPQITEKRSNKYST